jgi:hypothetical protein
MVFLAGTEPTPEDEPSVVLCVSVLSVVQKRSSAVHRQQFSRTAMPILHDPATRDAIRSRVQRLRADANRLWGKMTVDQMLWHVNQALEQPLGRIRFTRTIKFVPRSVVKFFVLNTKWPKGAPTTPEIFCRRRAPFV